MTDIQKQAVKWIREDVVIGSGTCTTIDEAYEDEELIEALARDGVHLTQKTEVIAWARDTERLIEDHANDIRNA